MNATKGKTEQSSPYNIRRTNNQLALYQHMNLKQLSGVGGRHMQVYHCDRVVDFAMVYIGQIMLVVISSFM